MPEFPSSLKLFIGKSLPFLFTPIWICAPRFKAVCRNSLTAHLCLADSGWIASISVLQTNLPVAVVMMVVAGFFTVNAVLAVILLKLVGLWGKNLIYGPALTAVPLPPRSTLSTGGLVPASPRPSRSSPKKSWPTVLSRPSPRTPPPPLLRGSLAGVGEIRGVPAPFPPRAGLRSDQHACTALEGKKTTWTSE